MASATGITVIKQFTYRGDTTERYSNTYWFTGAPPSTDADWRDLFDALVDEEKTCYYSGVSVVGGYGYDDDSPTATAVWSVDLTVSPETPVAGTLAMTGLSQLAGDAAVWARWKTSRLNAKGKAIYLRKYFHPATFPTAGHPDTTGSTQKTNLETFAETLRDASFIDGRTITARGENDAILSVGASSYNTTRTLKRRGKRPTS